MTYYGQPTYVAGGQPITNGYGYAGGVGGGIEAGVYGGIGRPRRYSYAYGSNPYYGGSPSIGSAIGQGIMAGAINHASNPAMGAIAAEAAAGYGAGYGGMVPGASPYMGGQQLLPGGAMAYQQPQVIGSAGYVQQAGTGVQYAQPGGVQYVQPGATGVSGGLGGGTVVIPPPGYTAAQAMGAQPYTVAGGGGYIQPGGVQYAAQPQMMVAGGQTVMPGGGMTVL